MIERHLVPGQPKPYSHYCHVVRGGDHVWVSGAVGIKADGTIPAGTVEQFRVALDSVDACLRAAGAGAAQVEVSQLVDPAFRVEIEAVAYTGP